MFIFNLGLFRLMLPPLNACLLLNHTNAASIKVRTRRTANSPAVTPI